MLHELLAIRPLLRIDLDHDLKHIPQITREMLRNFRQLAFQDLCVQALHVFRLEGRLQGDHFVYDAAKAPDIALYIIRFILPHFGAGVVRRAGLRVVQALRVRDLRHVHVPELGGVVVVEEDVGALQVSMHDLDLVHGLQSAQRLNQNLPNLPLFDVGLHLLVIANLLEHVAVVGQLHDDAEALVLVVEKRLLVLNHIGMPYGRQDAHLIDGIIAFLLAQVVKFDFLHGILLAVLEPPDLVDLRIRAITYKKKRKIKVVRHDCFGIDDSPILSRISKSLMVDVAAGCPFEVSIDEVFVFTFDMLCLSRLLSFVTFRDLMAILSCELCLFFSTLFG